MGDFIYNEESRLHTLDGVSIPSVSQIIAPLSDFSKIPPNVLENKRRLGVEFHRIVEIEINEGFYFGEIDPLLKLPVDAFRLWWSAYWMDFKNPQTEKPLFCKRLNYCGKPDLVSKDYIVDWKLSKYNAITAPLQLEAYDQMLPKTKGVKRELIAVCFDLDGGVKMHNARGPRAWGVFRKMLDRYNSEQEFKNLLSLWKGAK